MTNQNTENIEDEVNCKSEEVFESSITNSYPLVAIDTSSKIYESSSKVKHSSDLSGSKEYFESNVSNINAQEPINVSTRPRILQTYRRETLMTEVTTKPVGSSTSASIHTQTDSSWINDMKMLEQLKKEMGLMLDEDETKSEISKTEEDEHESRILSPVEEPVIESVGPPKILQFHPESKKKEFFVPDPTDDYEPIEDIHMFFKDFNVYLKGNNPCEFCGQNTLPWPTIKDQEKEIPNTLFCCNDYRDFVEAIVEIQTEKESAKRNATVFTNKVKDEKKQSKKARRLAKERQEQRNLERELARQKKLDEIEKQSVNAVSSPSIKSNDQLQNSQQSQQQISKQLKSINYQLSNLRYIHEGWTVRPDSAMSFDLSSDENDDDVIVPASLSSSVLKRSEKPLTYRYYKNGDLCMILFPDGTGNVFYPSGRLAISISLAARGMHIFTVFHDDEINPLQLGIFDPYGNVCCNYLTGKLRVQMSPFGGIELDIDGSKKKRWLWWETEKHVHAPPWQPLVFTLNHNISVKIHSQQKIYISFFADTLNLRFLAGSNLTISKPELLPVGFKKDSNKKYLKEKKLKINELLRMLRENIHYPPKNEIKLPKINEKNEPKVKNNQVETSSNASVQVFALTQAKEAQVGGRKITKLAHKTLAVP